MKKFLLGGSLLVAAAVLFVAVGAYNVAADSPHFHATYLFLQKLRERSITVRASNLDVPSLDDPARIRKGAGNYDAMCTGCHLAPGKEATEMSVGLYPAPPNLTKTSLDPAKAFWVIKHGIKASGMPAWGRRMEDEHVWDLVAFLRKLPTMSSEHYAREVEASDGHSHGGEALSNDGMNKDAHDKASMPSHAAADSQLAEHAAMKDGTKTPAMAAARAFHAALSNGDARSLKELLDPNVVIMESGHVERSRQEYSAHHLASDLKFMKAVTYKREREYSDASGTLAWVASEAHLVGEVGGEHVNRVSLETLVLRKSNEQWKVTHIHWSSRAGEP